MNIPLRKSLRTQFTIWTFLAVSLLATTVLVIYSYRSYRMFLDDYRETLSERMKHVASSMESMIEETDYLGVSRQANSLLLTYGVIGVKVVDANNKPIILKGVPSGFSIQQPILDGDRQLGLIQVNFSDIPIRNKIRHLIVNTLFITLAGIPLTALLMWFLCGWKLKDILRLSHELHQVGDINSEDINLSGITRQDEIGHLARSLVARSKAIRKGIERQQLLVRAIDQSHDSIIITNEQGTIEYVNPAFSRITGFSHDEAIGQNLRMVKSGKHPAEFFKLMWQRLTSGKTWHGRIINKRKDNVEYQEEATISPVFDSEGSIHHYVAVKRDVTKEVILEERLNQAKKMEAIGLMAGGIAHDLNNILTGIIAYPDLLLRQLPEDSELRELIKEIKESGRRASDIVAELLTIARGVAAARVVVNLNTLVTEHLDSPEHRKIISIHHNVTCSTSLESEIHPIACSPIHIRKCLMNLIINGAESIEGAGSILISTRNQSIENPITQGQYIEKGQYSVLTIQDTGKGIPEKDFGRIFEPFYTKKIMGRSGTGLGLTVVWNTIQDHGGYITVQSSEKGTCFDLYFPVSHEEQQTEKSHSRVEPVQGNGEHILVVDDDRQLRNIAVETLRALNYKASSVNSGEEAVKFLSQTSVDLILLDMLMGSGMNGRETYEEILKIRPGQKALIVSGFSKSDEVKKALRLGAGGFIQKPFDMVDLAAVVSKELKNS